MSLEERAKAAAKNIEGKAQEAIGSMTGDQQAQVEGKAKQAEAEMRNAKEDIKDSVKNIVDKA
ncbi:CsbD family protein [Cyanobacteria bacterium FACHB-DQ100]|uniref:CsbD family protein n=1 Tax=unclassified Leptolyngbya TaxID=2650499 RepID=UPI001680F9C2|nr:CsbD family protein [Leptolyngbya sp. FACHB-17]MBD1821579.1 CsbD family protein [Cyanobacteria bacterium FACHB-DQ100]MBD2080645.1 CsbD family protein [Leptolyngbya sp. FACHB-17]